jgi:pSer/pThr/pTyr-binding forkhead associated (FHA) protein
MSELVVVLDKQIVKRVPVKGTRLTIGRQSDCDIVLPDRTISHHHARITVIRDDCFLEDLDSTNGTYVNQYAVQQHYLEDGDNIALGKYKLVFRSSKGLDTQLQRLGLHPRLLDTGYAAWLKVMDGRKAGYVIPLKKERVVLGNLQTGQVLIEPNTTGEFVIRNITREQSTPPRTLAPGEEFQVEDTHLQFCLKSIDA